MAKRRRRMFSAAESAEVWDRWQRGEGLKLIGRVLDRSSGAIFQPLKPHGGIRPLPRRRSRRVLSIDDREKISSAITNEGSGHDRVAGRMPPFKAPGGEEVLVGQG
jgi:hypothetical protein